MGDVTTTTTTQRNTHDCAKQEEFNKLLESVGGFREQIRGNGDSIARMERSMEKTADNMEKISSSLLTIQATQVTNAAFNSKFEESEDKRRSSEEKLSKESIARAEALHTRISKAVDDTEMREKDIMAVVCGIGKTVDKHDLYFWLFGIIIMIVITNPGDFLDIIRKIV